MSRRIEEGGDRVLSAMMTFDQEILLTPPYSHSLFIRLMTRRCKALDACKGNLFKNHTRRRTDTRNMWLPAMMD